MSELPSSNCSGLGVAYFSVLATAGIYFIHLHIKRKIIPPNQVSPESTALTLCPKQKITVSVLCLAWTFIAVPTLFTLGVRAVGNPTQNILLVTASALCFPLSVRFLHLPFCHLTAARQPRWIMSIGKRRFYVTVKSSFIFQAALKMFLITMQILKQLHLPPSLVLCSITAFEIRACWTQWLSSSSKLTLLLETWNKKNRASLSLGLYQA